MLIVTKIQPAKLREVLEEMLKQQVLQQDVCAHQALIGSEQVRQQVALYEERIGVLQQFLHDVTKSERSMTNETHVRVEQRKASASD